MTIHTLKLNDRYFDAVANGIKTFEIRKDDRGFRVGDVLRLYRVNDEGMFTPGSQTHPIFVVVRYILTHADFPAGIPEGYVVMSIERSLL